MPYVQRIIRAGKIVLIERYFTSRYKKRGLTRSDRVKPTSEEQKKCNTRRQERALSIILAANFVDGDLHINFGYIRKKGLEYRTKEQMRKDMDIFLRALRTEYKKAGKELKYVHVMEIGDKGSRHHHLVINYMDIRVIQKCWKKAYPENSKIHVSPLDTNGDYTKLASYLIKYTDKTVGTEKALQGKRWNPSKNLVRPEPEYTIIKDRGAFSHNPKPIKGYYIVKDSIEVGIHNPEYYGYGFIRYRMVMLEEKGPEGQEGGKENVFL